MAYGLNIVDGIGNEHPRKNLYLKDLGLLEEKSLPVPIRKKRKQEQKGVNLFVKRRSILILSLSKNLRQKKKRFRKR